MTLRIKIQESGYPFGEYWKEQLKKRDKVKWIDFGWEKSDDKKVKGELKD